MKQTIVTAIFLSSLLAFNCSSKEVKDEEAMEYKYEKVPLPQGQADIEAEVISISENNDKHLSKVKVLQVNGYGPQTPPIAVNKEIVIVIPEKEKQKFTKNYESKEKLLLRINHAGVNPAGMESEDWTFVQFNKR